MFIDDTLRYYYVKMKQLKAQKSADTCMDRSLTEQTPLELALNKHHHMTGALSYREDPLQNSVHVGTYAAQIRQSYLDTVSSRFRASTVLSVYGRRSASAWHGVWLLLSFQHSNAMLACVALRAAHTVLFCFVSSVINI